jgi:hypothetical protein
MGQSIIAVKIPISQKGEQHFFQVNIPKDKIRITGVQTGMSNLQYRDSLTGGLLNNKDCVGSIKLQSERAANLCYCTDVRLELGYQRATLTSAVSPLNYSNAFNNWMESPFVGGAIRQQENMLLKNCFTLYGCFTDELGVLVNRNLSYTIGLYLWIE